MPRIILRGRRKRNGGKQVTPAEIVNSSKVDKSILSQGYYPEEYLRWSKNAYIELEKTSIARMKSVPVEVTQYRKYLMELFPGKVSWDASIAQIVGEGTLLGGVVE